MSANCHRCGAFDPGGIVFRSERIPFRGTRIYCPKCHAKLEESFLLGILAVNIGLGLFGLIFLLLDASSKVGHVLVNLFLVQLIIMPSIVIHEFAHAIVGKLSGFTVLKIWIGRGKTFYRVNILGFDTEFKMIPFGGLTFLAHGLKGKLHFRYFLTVLAGPLANAIILVGFLKFASWGNFNLETTLQFGAFIVSAQALILIENLMPYRIQTAAGKLCTDGLSLFQLLSSKSPEVLHSRFHFASAAKEQTWTK